MDYYNRNYSVSNISTTNSSNGSPWAYTIADTLLVADEGYLASPPSSRRTSQVVKLPSIHELERSIAIESPQERDSLTTITEETSKTTDQDHIPHHHNQSVFHPDYNIAYAADTTTSMSKIRSNSFVTSNQRFYQPPPIFSPPSSPFYYFHPEPNSKLIVQALVYYILINYNHW